METRAVACSSCKMWEVRVAAGVPSDFTREKCTQLQLLTNHIRELELELELDELRIIQEAEGVIDRSYKVVVTPKVQEKGSWVNVRRGKGNRQTGQGSPVAVPLNNKYTILDTFGGGNDLPGEGHSRQVSGAEPGIVAHKGSGENRRAIVVGDSIVRGKDRWFCEHKRDERMLCCLLGARVHDILDRVFKILKGEGEQPAVMVHIDTNDIGRKRTENVKNECRELGWKLKSMTNGVVISGLLPVPRDNE
eukprot:g44344.t1